MSEVWLDGEQVDFQGPAPSSTSEVWAVLEQYLGGVDRVVAEFLVDDEEWNSEGGEVTAYQVVRAQSRSQEENLALIANALIDQKDVLLGAWREVSLKVLSTGWESFQQEAIGVLNVTQPLLENCGLLTQFANARGLGWEDSLQQASQGMEGALGIYMDAFEAADCVALSDCAAVTMTEALGLAYDGLALIGGEASEGEVS